MTSDADAHPTTITDEVIAAHQLRNTIKFPAGNREPTLGIFSVMWSTVRPTREFTDLDAGIIDIGDNMAIAFKISTITRASVASVQDMGARPSHYPRRSADEAHNRRIWKASSGIIQQLRRTDRGGSRLAIAGERLGVFKR